AWTAALAGAGAIDPPQGSALLRAPAEPGLSIDPPQGSALLRAPAEPGLSIVHLAGESVSARRWDARQRQVIRDSRVETTRTIVEALAALPAGGRPASLISASGTDYYPFADEGPGDDDEVAEGAAPGGSFLARVCRDWEAEARAAEPLGVRVVTMRTGLVLGGGAGLAKMSAPFKLFVGGRIGSGRQWLSWMHRDDAAAAYAAAVHDERYRGPVNLVTGSVRAGDFARAL